jgi:3-deoxy-D-manno-octulosonic-acid transferase
VYALYNFFLWSISLTVLPWVMIKRMIAGTPGEVFRQKLGAIPPNILQTMVGKPRIWVHAVSAGEVSAIHPLIRELRCQYPEACIMLSTGTESGQKVARERVPEATAFFYFPLDIPWIVRRVVRSVQPDLCIMAETELWPNFLRIVKKEGAHAMLANGRISVRSFERYRKTRFFWMGVLDHFDVLSMIRIQDGERIIAMGADPVRVFVNGNCKFDQAVFSAEPIHREGMKKLLEVGEDDPVLIAGSTHEGEEEVLLRVYLRIREKYPKILLFLVPRHVERAEGVEKLCTRCGIKDVVRRSEIDSRGRRGARVVLWDIFGELFKVYSVGTVVFCGGSLIPRRGQNILEPAAWGKVVLYGPSMEDFADARQLLESVGAGIQVRDEAELLHWCLELLDHPQDRRNRGEAGKEIVFAQRGAARRNLEVARRLLSR